MRETEITVQIFNSLDEIKEILQSQGYKLTCDYKLIDWYFSKYDDVKEMDYPTLLKNSFLVRYSTDKPSCVLCYKDKEIDKFGNVISEVKYKTHTEDPNKAVEIFTKAGLNLWNILKTHLLCYKKEDIEFAVQIVDGLGIFIEYEEIPAMEKLSPQEKINRLVNTIKSLGLDIGEDYSCKKVYMNLHKSN